MITEESICWQCGEPTQVHRHAVENFMKSVHPSVMPDIDCIIVYPGMIEGLTKGLYPVARRLYDADTGEIFDYDIETLISLPIYTELHISDEAEDDGLPW